MVRTWFGTGLDNSAATTRVFVPSAPEDPLTEVPEHLLNRSKSRRASLGLGGGDAAAPAAADAPSTDVAPAASTPSAAPAAAAAARPAAVEPAAPEPLAPYIEAAVTRKKIPVWVMPALIFLPVWGILYAQSFSKAPSSEPSQLEAGVEVYNKLCASCHGGGGEGGVGRPFADGEVVKTFPDIASQMEFILVGTDGAGVGVGYGDPDRPGGQHLGGSYNGNKMPAFNGVLTDAELLEVTRHERETLGGEELEPNQIGENGALNNKDGKPYLNAAGTLVDEAGEPLFDPATGKLVTPLADSLP
jgi:mono/diheme cytochrome c family protein